jgi:hypothetical protein
MTTRLSRPLSGGLQLTLRREDELVLLCARTQVDEQTSARIQAIAASPEEVDWDYVYALARRHSVVPLVYFQLNANAVPVPPDKLARFKDNYQSNAARNLLLTAELGNVLQSLEAAGIEAVPYKGPALAVYAYGNLMLRRFVDLDILVRKADVSRAKEILMSEGFVCGAPWTSVQQALLLRTQHNLAMSREEGRLVVELHWEVVSGLFASSLQAEEFWGRLSTMTLNNATVKSLATEDLLLSLCVHGSKHLWERLAWICDVAQIMKSQEVIDWDTLFQRAEATGSARMLLLGLSLANNLLDAPLPAQAQSRVESDSVVPGLVSEVSRRLFASGEPMAITIGQSFRFNWAVRSDLSSRLRYCRLLLQPTDADIETLPLPRPLSFVYYLMRPFGLLKRDRSRREAATRKLI